MAPSKFLVTLISGWIVWEGMIMLLMTTTSDSGRKNQNTVAAFEVPVEYNHHIKNKNRPKLVPLSSSSSSNKNEETNEVELLQERARKLRQEIDSFERLKNDMKEEERRRIQLELDEKQAYMDRYSVIVPILKPDGSTVEEKITFPPKLSGNKGSTILVVEAPLPLGILLGEHETLAGMTAVDEVANGTNGQAAGIQEGDLLRACTACRMEMVQPTWQLMAGGIGRPKTVRFMFGTDGKPFEQVMEAVASNRMDPEERPVLLVLEREEM